MEVKFDVNQYDSDGDIVDECILLYFNRSTIIRIDKDELQPLIDKLEKIKKEISENFYPSIDKN